MSKTKVVLGVLAGVVIGSIAGILFAPDKGSKTRKQILDKGENFTDDLKTKMTEFCDNIMEKFETTKQEAENMFSKGKVK